eukprot:9532288-Alexandrium_andersonii.AAC.1
MPGCHPSRGGHPPARRPNAWRRAHQPPVPSNTPGTRWPTKPVINVRCACLRARSKDFVTRARQSGE